MTARIPTAAGGPARRETANISITTQAAKATAGRYRNRSAMIVPTRMIRFEVGSSAAKKKPMEKKMAAFRHRDLIATATAAQEAAKARTASQSAQDRSCPANSGTWL